MELEDTTEESGPLVRNLSNEYGAPEPRDDVDGHRNDLTRSWTLRNGGRRGPFKERYGWCELRPSFLQFLNNAKGFTAWLCLFGLLQGYVTNGLVFTDTTTLEQRFGLPSVQTGFLASTYDIAMVCVVFFVTYFGERGNKPLWLGYGAAIFAAGLFMFALPQFTTGPYEPSTALSSTCEPEANETVDACGTTEEGLSSYFWVFVGAQCLHGLGAAPIYTLGVAYLDESVSPGMSSIYLGIVQTTSIMGPALGYLLGGYFLSIYVDPGIDPKSLGLSSDSPLWIGAWWIGFIVSGALALLVTIPLLGFPKHLPDAENVDGSLDRCQTQKGSHFISREGFTNELRDLPRATRTLFTNVPYMMLNLATATEWFIISCQATFAPKFLESEFAYSSTNAAFVAGSVTIPSSAVGTLLGAYAVKHFSMSFKGMVRSCLASLVISLFCISAFVVSCPDLDVAGVTVPYYNSFNSIEESNISGLVSGCNNDCHCNIDLDPVCGSDNVIYYSACFAGCLGDESAEDGSTKTYTNCTCIPTNVTGQLGYAELGLCAAETWPGKSAFFALVVFMLAFTFFTLVPSTLAVMRSVSHSQRAFALGVQSVIYRALGAIPGPIVLGALVDSVCIMWEVDLCADSENCWLYDNASFSRILLIVSVVLRCLSLGFLALSLIFYQPSGNDEKEGEGQEETKEELNDGT